MTQLESRPVRPAGRSYQDVLRLEQEYQTIPDVLFDVSPPDVTPDPIDTERYSSYEFHRMEVEKVWRKVWQMACREEEIPSVGDHVVYDIAEHSIIVVRVEPDKIKAFHNSCLHRATQLRAEGGCVPFFRCTYHGWTYELDGTLRKPPSWEWDLPNFDYKEQCLPECKVAVWGGFVFINMDPDADELSTYLGVLPEHFQAWPLENRFKAVHVARVLPCNWKVWLEAFVEVYHVAHTHPHLAASFGDESVQNDTYGDHVSRFLTPAGMTSSQIPWLQIDEQGIVDAFLQDFNLGVPEGLTVAEGQTARDVLSDAFRGALGAQTGVDYSKFSNAEIIDAIEYFLFPNMMPWGGWALPLCYRIRPNGDDPNSSIWDIMLLLPFPEGHRPPPAKVHWVENSFLEAPELGPLAPTLDQDYVNLVRVQRGLQASHTKQVHTTNYQEARVRHFHRTLDKYLAAR